MVIYHPPGSSAGKNNPVFLDEFCDFVASISMDYENILYLGDFNLHVNNSKDMEAVQFLDMIEALGLNQNIKGATHRLGNTLGLILTGIFRI